MKRQFLTEFLYTMLITQQTKSAVQLTSNHIMLRMKLTKCISIYLKVTRYWMQTIYDYEYNNHSITIVQEKNKNVS